jgi:hypothetical protein
VRATTDSMLYLSLACSPVGSVNDGGTGAVTADALHPSTFSGQPCIACVIPAPTAIVFPLNATGCVIAEVDGVPSAGSLSYC